MTALRQSVAAEQGVDLVRRRPSAVRRRRIELGFSQTDLAGLSRLNRATVVRVELGQHRPRRRTRALIAQALFCSEAELFPDPPAAEGGNGATR